MFVQTMNRMANCRGVRGCEEPDGSDFHLDYYLSYKRQLALFEYKDCLFVKHDHYDDLWAEIKKKLANDVGVDQLFEQIKKFSEKPSLFEKLLITKNRKIPNVVHPVLVVAEDEFILPGLAEKLDGLLQEKIQTLENMPFFVSSLIVVELEFFLNHMDVLKSSDFNIFSLFRFYRAKWIHFRIRARKTGEYRHKMATLQVFREICSSYMQKHRGSAISRLAIMETIKEYVK